jgi:hypothetical protein
MGDTDPVVGSKVDDALMKHVEGEMERRTHRVICKLVKYLYKEMLATIQETDYTTPGDGDWWYHTLYRKSYTVHRAPKTTKELNIVADGKAESPSCQRRNRARRERVGERSGVL